MSVIPPTPARDLNTLIDHFSSVDWCSKILRAPGIVPFIPPSRLDPQYVPEGALPSRDQLFRRLLNNEDGVPYCLGFYQDPLSQLEPTSRCRDFPFFAPSVSIFFDLRAGLSGFNRVAHGGFVGTLMDEVMGTLIYQSAVLTKTAKAKGLIPASPGEYETVTYVTARTEISYRRPLEVPQIVVATATVDRFEGKKMHIDVNVKGGDGKEYATGRGTWVSVQRSKL